MEDLRLQLRAIVGDSLSSNELDTLLRASNFSLEAAVNAFFDAPSIPPAPQPLAAPQAAVPHVVNTGAPHRATPAATSDWGQGSGYGSGSESGSGHTRDARDEYRVFLPRIPDDLPERALRIHFGKFGPVNDCFVPTDPATAAPKGFAFVSFVTRESMDAALAVGWESVGGHLIEVRKANPKPDRKALAPTAPAKSWTRPPGWPESSEKSAAGQVRPGTKGSHEPASLAAFEGQIVRMLSEHFQGRVEVPLGQLLTSHRHYMGLDKQVRLQDLGKGGSTLREVVSFLPSLRLKPWIDAPNKGELLVCLSRPNANPSTQRLPSASANQLYAQPATLWNAAPPSTIQQRQRTIDAPISSVIVLLVGPPASGKTTAVARMQQMALSGGWRWVYPPLATE
jgi:hypothetical protein